MVIKKIDATNYDVGEYMVHLEPESCTCMYWTIRGEECKHLREIKLSVLASTNQSLENVPKPL